MSKPMPVSDFRWLSEEEIKVIKWENTTEDQEYGYIVECDLIYPQKLHNSHNSFPLAPESAKITSANLSPYAQGIYNYITIIIYIHICILYFIIGCHEILHPAVKNYSSTKLTATFNKRIKYTTHYINLKLYLRLGLKIVKIRRVLAFKQSVFLKDYIDKCTELRKQSTNAFSKSLWKLFANAVFGKFIECTREYLNVKIAINGEKCKSYISKPNYSSMKIVSENVVLIFNKQPTAFLNKAIPIGFTILERSKEFMYQQFYDIIRPALGNVEVIMSDTDSFLLAVQNEKKTNNLNKIKHIMDFSNYDPEHKLYSETRKNELGFFKDELCGCKMKECVALRAKSYTIKLRTKQRKNKVITKCKGITKAGQRQIRFDNYKRCLKTISNFSIRQWNIRSKNHCLQMTEVNKVALNSFDDKRHLFQCGVHSVAYGSFIIKRNKKSKCPMCEIFCPLEM